MEGDGFYSVMRTRFVLCCVYVVCFTSAVCSSRDNSLSHQTMMLRTSPEVVARCGDNVTLTCDASSSQQFEIKKFIWISPEKPVCQFRGGKPDPGVVCENKSQPLQSSLSMTLINMLPAKQGEYICKLHSTLAIKDSTTIVKLQECFQSNGSSQNKSHAECWFNGFYPNGTVHWFHAGVNLTESASTQQELNEHGLYNVKSILKREPQNTAHSYTCSLWIPALGKYQSNLLVLRGESRSSGSRVSIPWMYALVTILLIMFMT
ncbi:uncharacterized protein LOC117528105 [Thalassophryne amazonica]|uniref:uncharacterized protein LOC117528105 n=1 Tax=Thalassophryne amazonica TaxID=390379 RepID=UPI001471222F|nr:uncharacterized protein LOC117528105 [Thalassophryne amazonica]